MIWLAAGLLAGILLHLLGIGKALRENLWGKAMAALLALLLFSIGLQLGLYPDLAGVLSRLGFWSLILAVAGAGGAFLAGFLYPTRRERFQARREGLLEGDSAEKVWLSLIHI